MRIRLVQLGIMAEKNLWFSDPEGSPPEGKAEIVASLVAALPRNPRFTANIQVPIDWLPPDIDLGDTFNLFIEKTD